MQRASVRSLSVAHRYVHWSVVEADNVEEIRLA